MDTAILILLIWFGSLVFMTMYLRRWRRRELERFRRDMNERFRMPRGAREEYEP
jgi:hypothetical protein